MSEVNPEVSDNKPQDEPAPAAPQVAKGDAFRFTRSNTIVYVTLVKGDGTFDVEERTSQAKDKAKQPIPPRYWGGVSRDALLPVE